MAPSTLSGWRCGEMRFLVRCHRTPSNYYKYRLYQLLGDRRVIQLCHLAKNPSFRLYGRMLATMQDAAGSQEEPKRLWCIAYEDWQQIKVFFETSKAVQKYGSHRVQGIDKRLTFPKGQRKRA